MKLYALRFVLAVVLSVSSSQIFASKTDSSSVSQGLVRKFFDVEKTQKIMMATLAKPTPFYNRDSLLKHFKQFFANPELVDYQRYVEGMATQLKKKINILEYDDIRNVFQLEQLTDLRGRYSLVNSATCLVNKQEGHFIRVKDADGRDIMTQPLENEEKYETVDTYNQGFARIKQGKSGYGFLNICGEEIVKCQYSQAENFNDGRALVKKNNDWFFVDINGHETSMLKNVVDALALAKGISLVRFKNGKYALIDNLFDKTESPVSDIYDSIEPLRYDRFKVTIGSESKIINLETIEVHQLSVGN
jgi:WG containing repeat